MNKKNDENNENSEIMEFKNVESVIPAVEKTLENFNSPENQETPEKVKKVRKPRVSKIQAETEIPPFSLIDKNTCLLISGLLPFSLLALGLKKPEYELDDIEKESLAPLWDKVIQKYLPQYLNQYACEVSLGIAISLLLIKKSGVLIPKTKPQPKEERVE
jgi:hypothetical protein